MWDMITVKADGDLSCKPKVGTCSTVLKIDFCSAKADSNHSRTTVIIYDPLHVKLEDYLDISKRRLATGEAHYRDIALMISCIDWYSS